MRAEHETRTIWRSPQPRPAGPRAGGGLTAHCSPALLNHSVRAYLWAAGYALDEGHRLRRRVALRLGLAPRPRPREGVRQSQPAVRGGGRSRGLGLRRGRRLAGRAPAVRGRGHRAAHVGSSGRRGGPRGTPARTFHGHGRLGTAYRGHPGGPPSATCSRVTRGSGSPRSSSRASGTRRRKARRARRRSSSAAASAARVAANPLERRRRPRAAV